MSRNQNTAPEFHADDPLRPVTIFASKRSRKSRRGTSPEQRGRNEFRERSDIRGGVIFGGVKQTQFRTSLSRFLLRQFRGVGVADQRHANGFFCLPHYLGEMSRREVRDGCEANLVTTQRGSSA